MYEFYRIKYFYYIVYVFIDKIFTKCIPNRTILVLYDTFYLSIKDLILQSYFNTFTHVNITRLGELTCEESDVS